MYYTVIFSENYKDVASTTTILIDHNPAKTQSQRCLIQILSYIVDSPNCLQLSFSTDELAEIHISERINLNIRD